MEDIAFGDWPGQSVDLNGSNHPWLPAYGFQQPILEKDDFLGSPDAALFLNGGGTHQYVFLETIMEETSDDLRSSDSERSTSRGSHDDEDDRHRLGWLATDSESGSVIRVNVTSVDDDEVEEAGVDSDNEDSSSECDIVCPAKRRRRHDINLLTIPQSDEDTSLPSLSRSSSLLQFETLEKRCQEDMYNSSPSILSTFSYDSLEIHNRNNKNRLSPDSLNNRSTGSDEDLTEEEEDCDYYRTIKIDKSTKKRNRGDLLFYKSKVTKNSDADSENSSSTESDDTLPSDETIHQTLTHHFKNRSFESLLSTKKMSTENLSEDSGYCDHFVLKQKSSSIPNFHTEIIPEQKSNKRKIQIENSSMNSRKKSTNGFGAYDCDTTNFTTNTASHFGTSYHDLSIFDPNKISVQFKNNLQKLGKYQKNLKTNKVQNNPIELIEEIDELERETQSLKLEIVSEFPTSKFSGTTSTSEPNLLSAVDASLVTESSTQQQYKNTIFNKKSSDFYKRSVIDHFQLNHCDGLFSSSVPQNLNLVSDINDSTTPVTSWNVNNSVAAKNIDLVFDQSAIAVNSSQPVIVQNDLNMSDISTDNNTIRIRLKGDDDYNDNKTVIGVEHDNSSFTLNDGVTKLLDVTADNRCYNLDIHSDILDFESNIQSAISNSSIPSFKDKADFFFHSTPMNRNSQNVQSTPNLTTIFTSESDGTASRDVTDSCKTVPLKKFDADSYMKGLSGSEGKNIGGILLGQRNSLAGSGSTTKGVHFCEIVSEVSWREASYSDNSIDDDSVEDEENDNQSESTESLDEIMMKVAEQIEEKDGSSYLIKDYTDKDGFKYKHSHMLAKDQNEESTTPTYNDHVTETNVDRDGGNSKMQQQQSSIEVPQELHKHVNQQCCSVTVMESNGVDHTVVDPTTTIVDQQQSTKSKSSNKKLGGFLSRFTNFRFSTRNKNHKKVTNNASTITTPSPTNQSEKKSTIQQRNNNDTKPDYIYIPLKGPPPPTSLNIGDENLNKSVFSKVIVDGKPLEVLQISENNVTSKPPLPKQPPRVIGASVKQHRTQTPGTQNSGASSRNTNIVNGGSIDSGDGLNNVRNNASKIKSNVIGYRGAIISSSGGSVDNRHATFTANFTTRPRHNTYNTIQMEQQTPLGLIETDLDTHITVVNSNNCNNNGKARSLMNLGGDNNSCDTGGVIQPVLHLGDGAQSTVRPHKSMEFLLDKQNLKVVEPPENELQKGGTGERVMSEHQLRVQRSLQKLNVPEWFKQSHVPREGFLLKKQQRENTKWSGLSGKTTSLSSLGGSRQSPILLSPSPQGTGGQIGSFTRWSTSKLNSTASSPCNSTRSSFNYRQPITGLTANGTSPCSSTRSSFNYRQPYLGWRSQERLTKPRTPAERLATSLLPATTTANSEIQSSIKEVTSAIVHYVSGLTPDTNPTDSLHVMQNNRRESSDRESMSTSPRFRDYETQETASQRSISPASRGSQKFCWLESSFVGTRPLDSPQTPMGIPTDASSELSMDTVRSAHYPSLHLDLKTKNSVNPTGSCYSYANSSSGSLSRPVVTRPSPGSTTLEDVLDSLLGLPPSTRAPSPSLQGTGSANSSPGHFIGEAIGSNRDRLLSVGSNSTHCDSIRRRSEGNTMQEKLDDPQRRVSFHMTPEAGQIDLITTNTVKCRYTKCTVQASHEHAKKYFKNCHNCNYSYCSRECRRAHWEKHRKTCLHSRASTLCRQILAKAKDDPESLNHISVIARRGYLSLGPGVVKCFFGSPEAAERFIENGLHHLSEPTYIRWSDLLPSEMGPELFSELVKICKTYNPETRIVLYVAVCVVSEVPTTGTIKWERQLVSRCAKLRLSKTALSTTSSQQISTNILHRSKSPCNITREMDNPETLILTSLPGNKNQSSVQKSREISFTNIQRQLKQRGVSLRRHFPDVYQKLCAYVEGASDRFAPVTVYPRDSSSGKSFMCIIMPDIEPEKLGLVPTDCSRVQTVDVSQEHTNE